MRVRFAILLLATTMAHADDATKPWIFDNRMMIAVDGADPVASAPDAPRLSITFDNGTAVLLQPMFDALVTPERTINRARTFTFGPDARPVVLRRWFTLDLNAAGNREAFGVPDAQAEENPWDIAHAMVDAYASPDRNAFEKFALVTGGLPAIIEPDIVYRRPDDTRRAASEVADSPSVHWPAPTTFGWHMEKGYTHLADARAAAAHYFADETKLVRIAHLDTGWDAKPDSITPRRFSPRDAWNFIPTKPDRNANDQKGHGTGTLSVLAGGRVHPNWNPPYDDDLGGVPLAWVTSYRIADSVVHIWPRAMSNAIAAAARNDMDVITMSAGGAPSIALRDAVNTAYERGVAMFFASGDFIRLPIPFCECFETPHTTVYPARFTRTISVTGVTASHKSYGHDPGFLSLLHGDWLSWMLRGSYGPLKVARHTVAAFSPNIARHAAPAGDDRVGVGFGGTSAATPQVAATAALWLQKNRDVIMARGWWRDWRKAQVAYDAITSTADHKYPPLEFGTGVLNSVDALNAAVAAAPKKAQEASIGFNWIRVIAAIIAPSNFPELEQVHRDMLAAEVAQLVSTSKPLQELLRADEDVESDDASYEHESTRLAKFKTTLQRDSRVSRNLAAALNPATIHLEKDKSATVNVRAHAYWNHSHIWALPGEVYRVEPVGHQRWVDFFIPSNAAGYSSFFTNWQKRNLRNVNAPFFALMVTTEDDDAGAYAVVTHDGTKLDHFQPARRGELTFFANDVPHFYWNNWGTISVRITRVQ